MPIEEYTQEFVKETLFRYDNVFDPGERASIASYHEEHHGSGRDLAGIDRLLTTLTLFRAVAVSRLAGTSEGRTETKTRILHFNCLRLEVRLYHLARGANEHKVIRFLELIMTSDTLLSESYNNLKTYCQVEC